MKVLQTEEITIELAEIILDKVHLAMTKENTYWQDTVMDDDKEVGEELYLLQKSCLKKSISVFQKNSLTPSKNSTL
ncbi:hypothetical protein [Leptospira mayottensis]|uniref:hypothetical protein n=1 Tax=Leptospira mayottensis TaxID=1137606 RepID=UPI001F5C30C8|nr:hypothetical protein [Leptospira mayottensis]